MTKLLGIVGTGGFAREIMPLALEALDRGDYSKVCFVETEPTAREINDINVLSENDFLLNTCDKDFCIAIADSNIRETIHNRFTFRGANATSLISNNAVLYHKNEIGKGSILSAFTTVTSNVNIGIHFHANIYSYVAHDCRIGDYVTFAPRVHCNGNVHIEDHVYVGTGAIIKQGTNNKPLVIGKGAVIGMGAVVTKSVPAGVTVVGNPAKDIKDRSRLRK